MNNELKLVDVNALIEHLNTTMYRDVIEEIKNFPGRCGNFIPDKVLEEKMHRHDLKYYKEEDNICDMQPLATVEFYKSDKTGKIYAEFILEDSCWISTKEIYPNEFTNLKEALLSFAEAENDT